jgi:hypothetical protein
VDYGIRPVPPNLTVCAVVRLDPPFSGFRNIVSQRVGGLNGWHFRTANTTESRLAIVVSDASAQINSTLAPPTDGSYAVLGVSFASGIGARFCVLGTGGFRTEFIPNSEVIAVSPMPLWVGAYDSSGNPAGSWCGRISAISFHDVAFGEAALHRWTNELWTGACWATRSRSQPLIAPTAVTSGGAPAFSRVWGPEEGLIGVAG